MAALDYEEYLRRKNQWYQAQTEMRAAAQKEYNAAMQRTSGETARIKAGQQMKSAMDAEPKDPFAKTTAEKMRSAAAVALRKEAGLAPPEPRPNIVKALATGYRLGEGMHDYYDAYGIKRASGGVGGEEKLQEGMTKIEANKAAADWGHKWAEDMESMGLADKAKEYLKAALDPQGTAIDITMSLPAMLDIAKYQLGAGAAANLAALVGTFTAGPAGTIAGGATHGAGIAAATYMEAEDEANAVYEEIFNEEIAAGKTPQEAHAKAKPMSDEASRKNLAILGVTNALEQVTMFGGYASAAGKAAKAAGKTAKDAGRIARLGEKIDDIKALTGVTQVQDKLADMGKLGKAIEVGGRFGIGVASEGTQEGLQYIASQTSMDKPWEFGTEFAQNVFAGAAMGGGMNIAGQAVNIASRLGADKIKGKLASQAAAETTPVPFPNISNYGAEANEQAQQAFVAGLPEEIKTQLRNDIETLVEAGLETQAATQRALDNLLAANEEFRAVADQVVGQVVEGQVRQALAQPESRNQIIASLPQETQAQLVDIARGFEEGTLDTQEKVEQAVEYMLEDPAVVEAAQGFLQQRTANVAVAAETRAKQEPAEPQSPGAARYTAPAEEPVVESEVAPPAPEALSPAPEAAVEQPGMQPPEGAVPPLPALTPTQGRQAAIDSTPALASRGVKLVEGNGPREKRIRALAAQLGLEVEFFDANNKSTAEFVMPSDPGVIYVRRGGIKQDGRSEMWALGHGFVHALKQQRPELYEQLAQVVADTVTVEQIKKYLSEFTPERQAEILSTPGLLLEEIIADEGGNFFLQIETWQAVNGSDATLFDKLVAFMREFLASLQGGPKRVENHLNELQIKRFAEAFENVINQVTQADAEAQATAEKAHLEQQVKRYNELIEEEIKWLKDQNWGSVSYMPDEYGTVQRASLNQQWYRDFLNTHGRAPRKGEWREMAINNLIRGNERSSSDQDPEFLGILSELSRGKKLSPEWKALQETIRVAEGQPELADLVADMKAEQARVEPTIGERDFERLNEVEEKFRRRMADRPDMGQYGDVAFSERRPYNERIAGRKNKASKGLQHLGQKRGGFTYDALNKAIVTEGVAVSPYPQYERMLSGTEFTIEAIDQYLIDNAEYLAKPDHKFGLWYNGDNDSYYLDISILADTREEATKVALEHNQLAVYDLGKGEEISVQTEDERARREKADRDGDGERGESEGSGSATGTDGQSRRGFETLQRGGEIWEVLGGGPQARGANASGEENGRPLDARRDVRRGNQRPTDQLVVRLQGDIADRLEAKGISVTPIEDVNPVLFFNAFKRAKVQLKRGAFVDLHTIAEYKDMKTFLTPGGYSGIAVEKNGNGNSFFHNAEKSGMRQASVQLILRALSAGLTKMDCYHGKNKYNLSAIYEQYGFVPVARVKWDDQRPALDGGEKPDIIFFGHNGDSVTEVADKIGTYPEHDYDALPVMNYEQAERRRDSWLKEGRGGPKFSDRKTDTPEFKKWFGKSKVADKEGNPLVVYHGSGDATFSAFDKGKANSESLFGPGFYFTENPDVAMGYSTSQDATLNGGVFRVYLSIEKPFDVDEARLEKKEIERISNPAFKDMVEFVGGNIARFINNRPDLAPQIPVVLQELGYDGITHIGGRRLGSAEHRVWIAFEPTQVKAVMNQGTWDPSNPDIRFSERKPSRRAKKREQKKTSYDNAKTIEARKKAGAVPPTYLIDTPQRWELRDNITAKLYGHGAARKERQVYIIIGPPGAGKSSALAEPIQKETGSLMIDADMAKEHIPEFKGGKYAGAVHEESAMIIENLLETARQNGDNIVLAIVGKSLNSIRDHIRAFEAAGYDVHLRLVDLPPNKAAARAVSRHKLTGRFVDPLYVLHEVGSKPAQNYAILEAEGGLRSYEAYSNDVPRGQLPKRIDGPDTQELGETQAGTASVGPKPAGRRERGALELGGPEAGRRRIPGETSAEVVPGDKEAGGFFMGKNNDPEAKFSDRKVAPTFFSQLQRVIEAKMPNKAQPGQILNIVAKGGVKQEEIDWSGIKEWLVGKKAAVTRDEVLEYLRENDVRVLEVNKGPAEKPGPEEKSAHSQALAAAQELLALGEKIDRDAVSADWDATKVMEQADRFSRLLFKAAAKRMADADYLSEVAPHLGAVVEVTRKTKRLARQYFDQQMRREKTVEVRYDAYALPGGEEYAELLLTLPYDWDDEHNNYYSSHWDEPNILGHIRFDTRTSAEGERVMFIEEVQSDWHQAGRKEGYSDNRGEVYASIMKEAETKVRELQEEMNNIFSGPDGIPEDVLQVFQSEQRHVMRGAEQTIRQLKADKVPNAPFKKTWLDLVLKRAIRYAAENGFDRLAWPAVEQVPEIENWGLAYEEIREDPVQSRLFGAVLDRYETGIPRFINKYVKKWGSKVETIQTPAAQPCYKVVANNGEFMGSFHERAQAEKYVEKWGKNNPLGIIDVAPSFTHPSVKITEAMKESVLAEGQPLFSDRKNPDMGKGWLRRGNITTVLEGAFDQVHKSLVELQTYPSGAGTYRRESIKSWEGEARKLIAADREQAIIMATDPEMKVKDVPVRLAMALQLVEMFGAEAKAAEAAGNFAAAQELWAKAADINFKAAAMFTKVGQGAASGLLWASQDSASLVNNAYHRAKKVYDNLPTKTREKFEKATHDGQQEMDRINGDAIDGVLDFEDIGDAIKDAAKKAGESRQQQKKRKAKVQKAPPEILAAMIRRYVADPEVKDTEEDPIKTMLRTLMEVAKEVIPKEVAPKAEPLSPIDILRAAMMNREKYRDVWAQAQEIFKQKYGLEFDGIEEFLAHYLSTPYAQNKIDLAAAKAIKDLELNILDAVAGGTLGQLKEQVIAALDNVPYLGPRRGGLLNQRIAEAIDRLAEQARDRAAKSLAKRVEKMATEQEAGKPSPANDMMTTLMKIVKKTMKEKGKPKPRNPMEVIAEAMMNRETYKEIWLQAHAELFDQYENDPKFKDLDKFFRSNTYMGYTAEQLNAGVSYGIKALDIQIKELIREHYSKTNVAGMTLATKLMEGLDLDPGHAVALESRIRAALDERTRKAKEQVLENLVKNQVRRQDRKHFVQKMVELSNLGAFGTEFYRNAMAKEMGIPVIDEEAGAEIMRLADLIQTAEGPVREEAMAQLNAFMSNLQEPGFLRKVSSFQTMMMLLNPKTNIRNIAGNELMYRADRISKYLGAPIDIARSALTGTERAVTFRTGDMGKGAFWSGFAKGWHYGWRGWIVKDITSQFDLQHGLSFRWRDDPAQNFVDFTKKWVNNVVLSGGERMLRATLQGFDYAAYNRAYNETMGELACLACINNKEELTKENIHKHMETLNIVAEQTAQEYGKYLTFQDDNVISDALVKTKGALNMGLNWGPGDWILKFPRTAGGLLMRGLEYSPLGVIRCAKYAYLAFGPEPKIENQRQLSLAVSRMLVGSFGITAFGAKMAALGLIYGAGEDDQDFESFARSQGLRTTGFNATGLRRWIFSGFDASQAQPQKNDLFITYDWAEPLAMSVAMGVSMSKGAEVSKTDVAHGVLIGLAGAINSVVEQPLLKGIQNLVAPSYGGDQTQHILRALGSLLSGIPASFMPSMLNLVRQDVDNVRRYTKGTGGLDVTEETLNLMKNKVPWLSKTLPAAIDGFGREALLQNTKPKGIAKFFHVYFNPAYVSRYNPTPEAKLALEIYQATGATKHFPNPVPTSININEQKILLSGKDRMMLQRELGRLISLGYLSMPDSWSKDKQAKEMVSYMSDAWTTVRDVYLVRNRPQELTESIINKEMQKAKEAQ